MKRRTFLESLSMLGGTMLIDWNINISELFAQNTPNPFVLPPLPYTVNALEPYFDATTMEIHYTKHHMAYVNNLNSAIKSIQDSSIKTDMASLMKLPDKLSKDLQTKIRNNLGGHANHSFFWPSLTPPINKNVVIDSKVPIPIQDRWEANDNLEKAIIAKFNSPENFRTLFSKAALSVFGSGWAWLVKDSKNNLSIGTTSNQDNPLMDVSSFKGIPILGLDVWEHAYYLKYHNRRNDYINSYWNLVNWKQANNLYNS